MLAHKILIVDDDKAIIDLLSAYIESLIMNTTLLKTLKKQLVNYPAHRAGHRCP